MGNEEMGNEEMGNEEMGNDEWEVHFTQQTVTAVIFNVMRKSKCPSTHSLRDYLCLTVGTKGGCNSIASKFFTFGHLLAFLKLVKSELFIPYTRSHSEVSSCNRLHCYGYTYICLTYSTVIYNKT